MGRQLLRGQPVTYGTVAPSVVALPSANRSPVHTATLEGRYPGGPYDSGTMWRLSNGAIVDESMMAVVS